MGWLEPTQDEVAVFHPAFEAVAREALEAAGLSDRLEWQHHPRTAGNSTIPDFVLRRRSDGRWLLAFELKRTRESVLSTRSQIQAKGYAETNQPSFARAAPCFFAISNLELTLLFALNGGAPPLECRLKEGTYVSGEFATTSTADHRSAFAKHLAAICERVAKGAAPEFDAVWPAVASALLGRADDLPPSERLALPSEPRTSGWDLVKGYFGAPRSEERVFLLRCLLAAFLRGFVERELEGARVPPIRTDGAASALRSLGQAIDRLRAIGFESLFDAPGGRLYAEGLAPDLEQAVFDYLKEIEATNVGQHARSRSDALELPGMLFARLYPSERDESGKVQTDPELARVLATLVLREAPAKVLDPCSGEGSLLAAAFDRLVALGVDPKDAMTRIRGVEADPISVRLGALRVALKDVRALAPGAPEIVWGDTFAHADRIATSDAILMNPPFKRYERQDARPVPDALREHYADAIRAVGASDGGPAGPTTTSGQANLFHYYVELVVRAAKPGARFGLILDNRWYHSQHGRPLREFLLESCALEALVEYPHWPFFEQHRIATSIVIARKERPARDAKVRFVRCRADPRTVDLGALARAYHEGAPWPLDWSERAVAASELDPRAGWKARFTPDLVHDFRKDLPRLADLFECSRRGSLNKEEGGVGVLEFPFALESFGHRRDKQEGTRRPYQTKKGDKLSRTADAELRALAAAIPAEFRGWALKNSDDVASFVLAEADVTRNPTLEPPALRAAPLPDDRSKRAPWSRVQDAAVDELAEHPATRAFLEAIARHTNLTEEVLPRHELWVALREPPAGELVIPRKTRSGHRVHVNPFVGAAPGERTVKLSSNFVSYSGCKGVAPGLERLEATKLIAAFLVSSFGQLQFEMLGYNREGLLSLECEGQLNEVRVLDPRSLRPWERAKVLEAFARVPAPVPTDRLSDAQPERNALDALFAEALAGPDAAELLREVHEQLDEWLTARQP